MNAEEMKIYHTSEEYNHAGLERFLKDSKKFSRGISFPPLTQVPIAQEINPRGEYLAVAFSAKLMDDAVRNLKKFKKPYEVILKYGYRGFSKGEKNGLLKMRKQDRGLITAVEKLYSRYHHEANRFLLPTEPKMIIPIKAVWHCTRGERMVGMLNKENNRAYILDYASY